MRQEIAAAKKQCNHVSYYILRPAFVSLQKKRNARKPHRQRTSEHCSCGGRTRTCDLQVMSLASYQLLHSAILLINSFLNCECKGIHKFPYNKIISMFFFKNHIILTYIKKLVYSLSRSLVTRLRSK